MKAITQDRLEACRRYARIDECDDDTVLELMGMAVEYLNGAGIPEPGEWSKRYALAINALTLHYYDHRDDLSAATAHPAALRVIINQLKLEAAVEAAAAVSEETAP